MKKEKKQQNRIDINSLPKGVKLFYALFMLLPAVSIPLTMNTDAYFMLNAGRYICQTKTVPDTDFFTSHAGMHAIIQQWLTDVIYWLLYSKLGEYSLIALVFIIYIAVVAVLFTICKKVSGNFIISVFCTSGAMLFICKPFMVTRPLTFTFLIILLEILILETYAKEKKATGLFFLPLLSVLLVNTQCSMWPMLFVVCLPYFIDSLKFNFKGIKSDGSYKTSAIILGALSMLVTGFINPYGIEGMTYLFTSYGYDEINSTVNEMFSPDIKTPDGKFYFAGILLVVLILIIYRKGRLPLRNVLFLLGFGYLGISSLRNFPFLAFSSAIALSVYLKDCRLYYKYTGTNPQFKKQCAATLMVVVLVMGLGFTVSSDESISGNSSKFGCEDAVEYALENYDLNSRNIYNSADIGGYLEFNKIKAHIDPRVELFLKDNNHEKDYLLEYVRFQSGAIHYKDYLNTYGFDFLFVSESEDILSIYLPKDNDYKQIYSNGKYSIYTLAKD